VPRVEVASDDIKQYSSDDQYMDLLVELTKEAASLLTVVACLTRGGSPTDIQPWPRNKAILCGLLVRTCKLLTGFMDSVCAGKFEFVAIHSRLIFETCVNLRFLIAEDSAETYESFVRYSLSLEARLSKRIHRNIDARGYTLPVEERMLASIQHSFSSSGVSLQEVGGKQKSWGNGLDQRARKVGLGDPYLLMFSLPSHAIHGNWEDLLRRHLKEKDGGFLPDPSWYPPRPQVFAGPLVVCLETGRVYLRHMFGDDTARLEKELFDLEERFRVVTSLHEAFVETRANEEHSEVEIDC